MKLDDILIQKGHASPADILRARTQRKAGDASFLHTLLDMRILSHDQLVETLSECYRIPTFDFQQLESVDEAAIKLLPIELIQKHDFFPIKIEDGQLHIVFSTYPLDPQVADLVRIYTDLKVRPYLAKRNEIRGAIQRFILTRHSGNVLEKAAKEAKKEVDIRHRSLESDETIENKILASVHSPVVRLVDLVIQNAIAVRASDIHVEPRRESLTIRYRVDGQMLMAKQIPFSLASSVIARIKIMSDLDIAEKRLPQDGRMSVSYGDKDVHLRVSILPVLYGEKAVMRILNHEAARILDIGKLGFNPKALNDFEYAMNLKHGIILVTGPTGSGKSTTIYTALNQLKQREKNITTIEDPVEHCIDGINQVQVHHKAQLTFASALRSALRQDPDVLFVGEIRDVETGDIAFKSSLTGHLVFSTLHTNGCLATITRLRDIGLEPFLIASSLRLLVAQRLLRLNCEHCKEHYLPHENFLERVESALGRPLSRVFSRSRGCARCLHTGYHGRTAVYESLRISDGIKDLIFQEAPETTLLTQARREGFTTLFEEAMAKAEAGITTIEEVYDVLDITLKSAPATGAGAHSVESKFRA